jgi:hypothetical protein
MQPCFLGPAKVAVFLVKIILDLKKIETGYYLLNPFKNT